MTTAIILPAYNEERAIAQTIRDFRKAAPDALIVVVDNSSSDRTAQVAEATFLEVQGPWKILSEPRQGKGNAVRRAFHEIQADIYVMADADATYLASDLPRLLEPVLTGNADLVVGNRHADSVYRRQNHRPFHDFGNRLVRLLINRLFHTQLQDLMSGYRVMTRRFVLHFPILSEGFELETEMSLQAIDKRFRVAELPIQYRKRPEGSFSKLNTFSDGGRVLRLIFWIFKDYRPFGFFSSLCALFGLAGLAVGIPVIIDFTRTGLVPKFPSAILATGLMIMSMLFFTIGLVLDTVAKLNREQFELRLLQFDAKQEEAC